MCEEEIKEYPDLENPDCLCPYDCENHGKCSQCQAYHKEENGKTFCGK